MIIGITGGMGCGKSTAVALFAERGFSRIDSDALVRDVVLRAPEVLDAIREKLGASVFGPDGQVDRKALAAKVFACAADRRWLESLTHPRLLALWREALCAAPRGTRWVVEVPLLFEAHLENWFDLTICVASSAPKQIARLEQRGVVRELAQQRILSQLPLAKKMSLADVVLWNDGALCSLQHQVEQLIASFA